MYTVADQARTLSSIATSPCGHSGSCRPQRLYQHNGGVSPFVLVRPRVPWHGVVPGRFSFRGTKFTATRTRWSSSEPRRNSFSASATITPSMRRFKAPLQSFGSLPLASPCLLVASDDRPHRLVANPEVGGK